MGAHIKSETFSVAVHLICGGQNEVISTSTLTLVRGGSHKHKKHGHKKHRH